jgi:hypothetical protein
MRKVALSSTRPVTAAEGSVLANTDREVGLPVAAVHLHDDVALVEVVLVVDDGGLAR